MNEFERLTDSLSYLSALGVAGPDDTFVFTDLGGRLPPRFASVPNCYPSFEVFLHIPNLEDIFSRYAVFHVTRAKLAETMPGTRCMLCSAEIGEHP